MPRLQTPPEAAGETQEQDALAGSDTAIGPEAGTESGGGAAGDARAGRRLRGTRPYDALHHHELIYLLDEIDDERSRARFREAVYISIIFWLLFCVFIVYGPKYLWHTPVIITAVPDQHRNTMTYLDTPPDLQRNLRRTKPAPHISEHSTEAQSPRPSAKVPEPRAGNPVPPAPRPQPQTAAPQPEAPQAAPAPAQQSQQQARNTSPLRTPAKSTPPLVDAPAPSPQRQPNFNNGASAGEAIQQAARSARENGSGGEVGDYGSTGRGSSGGAKVGTEVLSDTQGVDFGKYLARLLADVKRNWLPLIPEECRPPLNKQGITGVRFTIQPDGHISAMNLDYSTHDVAIDRAAWGSIRALGQAQPLPSAFHGPNLELRIEFRVNKDPQ